MAKKSKYCGKVKVGIATYRIYRKGGLAGDDGQGRYGDVDYLTDKIRLEKGRSKCRNYRTLWHEVIHAICADRNLDLSEEIVGNLTNGILLVLHDNPQLIAMIMEERFIKDVQK